MSGGPSPGRRAILDDPRLAAFCPLLYVAWADGDLKEDRGLKSPAIDLRPQPSTGTSPSPSAGG